jgi:AraC-like DNA-binding protein
LKTNRADKATLYIDSIAVIQMTTNAFHNTRILAYAEQEAYELEKTIQERLILVQKTRLVFISVILVLSLIAFGLLLYSYRKKQEKNRALYRQIKEQDRLAKELNQLQRSIVTTEHVGAEHAPPLPTINTETSSTHHEIQHQQLVARLHDYLLHNRNFANPEVTVAKLVKDLCTNRSNLFQAVKSVTGKTLKDFIHTLKLEEAKRLLDTTNELIETIAEMCGYSNASTFYRQFRERYTISPKVYRKLKNREEN